MSEKSVYEMCREFASKHSVVIVTAKQYPRPLGYVAQLPPQTGFIIVDYLTKISS